MQLRAYSQERDLAHIERIWREIGWMNPNNKPMVATTMGAGRTWVAEVDGAAEAQASTAPGTLNYLGNEIPLAAVTAVATSHVGRKKGLATRVLAEALQEVRSGGAMLAGLGMFDQGFYNRLGFGTGSYEHSVAFDPATLTIKTRARTPQRLGADDVPQMHAARLARLRTHGANTLLPVAATLAEVQDHPENSGLGYCDNPDGSLSHFIWFGASNLEHGPYRIRLIAYQTYDQFLELLALLRDISDQVNAVELREPAGIQLQDLIQQPLKHIRVQGKGYEAFNHAAAFWQTRILDLPGCLAHTHLNAETLRFNLRLSDPFAVLAADSTRWHGEGGDYTITLGRECGAERGFSAGLEQLDASVNAFSRLWLGVRPASGLAVTDDLSASDALLQALDRTLRLPVPLVDWTY
ncbi:MAG: GNAT family N-acetyltransferase [Chloroflexi bacterium]|nr:GNAT family N-acetyltransferase [Chloroflexota bacterium]